MMPPRAARDLVELLPIAFVPSRHAISLDALLMPLDAGGVQKVHRGFPSAPHFQDAATLHELPARTPSKSYLQELLVYITDSPAKHFPRLLYQTRYGQICFARFP